MLISDLVSLDANPSFEKTWSQVYLSCCSTERGGDCWRHCEGCCCHDLDFAHLREAVASHVYALDFLAPADKVKRAFWLMPEVYVAGLHVTHHCFGDVASWLASKDPLGILSLRLFFHEVESQWTQNNKVALDFRELTHAQSTWGMMQIALRIFSWRQIAVSGWPLLNLAKALYLFFEPPVTLIEEQEALWKDAKADGRFFRLLWKHAAPLKPFISSMQKDETATHQDEDVERQLQELCAEVSPKLRGVRQLVQAQLRHDDRTMPSCQSFALDEVSDVVADMVGKVPRLHDLIFHPFPVLTLLDRLLLPTSIWAGLQLCIPSLWRHDLAAATAARIRGTLVARPQPGSPGCQELQDLIKERDIGCMVDVGSMFGACAAAAANEFPEVRVVAYDKSWSNIRALERTAALSNLSVEAHAVCMVNTQEECEGCQACRTLAEEYPFGSEGRILLWMSQMSGPLHFILKGGRPLFEKQLIHTVAVMTIPKEINGIKRTLGRGYDFELRWQNSSLHSTVLLVASLRESLAKIWTQQISRAAGKRTVV